MYGITPARAGNTSSKLPVIMTGWDHPRACGEHREHSLCFLRWLGSPPRVRGTLGRASLCHQWSRITPARAGNTWKVYRKRCTYQDHPRACGEHATCQNNGIEPIGSPPRVRGTPDSPQEHSRHLRITPARAGNTAGRHDFQMHPEDHPRACGEHPSASTTKAISSGSPPRVRGTLSAPCRS